MPIELHKWASSQPKTSVAFRHAKVLLNNQVSCRSLQRENIVDDLVSIGLTKMAASDLLDEFHSTNTWGRVGIFWDLENVALPNTITSNITPSQVISAIREFFSRINTSRVVEFNAYCDQTCAPQSDAIREALHSASVRVIDTPHIRRKEVADKTIITDVMDFAFNEKSEKPVTVCLISGDGDFAHMLSKLRSRGVKTVVLHTTDNTAVSLISEATHAQTLTSLCGSATTTTNILPSAVAAASTSPKTTTPLSGATVAIKATTPPLSSGAAAASSSPSSDKKNILQAARKSPPLPPSPAGKHQTDIQRPTSYTSSSSVRKVAHPALPVASSSFKNRTSRMSVTDMVKNLPPHQEREVTLQQLNIRLEEMVPRAKLDATLRYFEAKFPEIDDIIYMLDTDGELRVEFGLFMDDQQVISADYD